MNFKLSLAVLALASSLTAWAGREVRNSPPGSEPSEAPPPQVVEAGLRERAEAGEAGAQCELGRMLLGGSSAVKKDEKEAAAWFAKAAEQGHAGAQCELGRLCLEGRGVGKDPAAAAQWYRKAAEQGDHRAQSRLGRMLMKGTGVERDDVQALMWFTLASAGNEDMGGYMDRKLILGRMTREQIAEARKRAAGFQPKKPSAP